jgi:hypothetical protein
VQLRPSWWYYSQADPIWPDGPFKKYEQSISSRVADPDPDPDPGGENDPQKEEFFFQVHVLKCWMASFES